MDWSAATVAAENKTEEIYSMGKSSSFAGDQNTNIPGKGRKVSADPALDAPGVVNGPSEEMPRHSAEEAEMIGGRVQQHLFSDPSGTARNPQTVSSNHGVEGQVSGEESIDTEGSVTIGPR